MKKLLLPFLLFAFLCSSCCKEDAGLLLLEVILPETPAGENGCDATKATAFADRFTANGYLRTVGVSDGSKALLAAYNALYWTDLNTGKVLKKTESTIAGKAFSNSEAIYQHGDLAIAASSTGLAVVNVKTGELVWERALNDCDIDKGVYGVGDQYFVTRHIRDAKGIKADAVFVGNLRNPEQLDLLFTPAYSGVWESWSGYGVITALAPLVGENGHTYILSSFFEPQSNTTSLGIFLCLYDVTAGTWIYERRAPLNTGATQIVTGVRAISVVGNTAYVTWRGQLIVWNIVSGTVAQTIGEANTMMNPSLGFDGEPIVTEHYLIVRGNEGLQVMDNGSHTLLYRISPLHGSQVQVDHTLDRLFVVGTSSVYVYELSTGKALESILAPCDQFLSGLQIWKDIYGALHVVVGATGDRIYHYVLQN